MPRTATEVPASFGKTWDAVIDVFAEENIPIRTMERASGFIAAEVATVPHDTADVRSGHRYADCGKFGPEFLMPTTAVYNVVVRGDSALSTVRVTIRFVTASPVVECSTRGAWEAAFEADVRARATGEPRPAVALSARRQAADSARAARSDSVVGPPEWAGDAVLRRYYRISPACKDVEAIPAHRRALFRTEDEAKQAGYRRSIAKGC